MVLRDSPGGSDMVPFSNRHWQKVCKMIPESTWDLRKWARHEEKKIGIIFSNLHVCTYISMYVCMYECMYDV